MNSLKKNLARTLENVEEILYRPKFSQEDYDRVKKQQLEGLKSQMKDPSAIASNVYRRLLYGDDHIYAVPASGIEESVNIITLEDVQNFYTKDGIAHNNSWDILEDENNNIWIASYGGGITKFDGKKFTVFNEEKGLVNNFVRKLFVFKKQVFIGTRDGISILNKKHKKIIIAGIAVLKRDVLITCV
mgnify:CR=1 FL=1